MIKIWCFSSEENVNDSKEEETDILFLWRLDCFPSWSFHHFLVQTVSSFVREGKGMMLYQSITGHHHHRFHGSERKKERVRERDERNERKDEQVFRTFDNKTVKSLSLSYPDQFVPSQKKSSFLRVVEWWRKNVYLSIFNIVRIGILFNCSSFHLRFMFQNSFSSSQSCFVFLSFYPPSPPFLSLLSISYPLVLYSSFFFILSIHSSLIPLLLLFLLLVDLHSLMTCNNSSHFLLQLSHSWYIE